MSKRNRVRAAIAAAVVVSAVAVSGPLASYVHPIGGTGVVAVEPGNDGH